MRATVVRAPHGGNIRCGPPKRPYRPDRRSASRTPARGDGRSRAPPSRRAKWGARGAAPEAGAANFEKEYGRPLPENYFRDQIANSKDLFREKLEALNGATVRALHAQGRQQVVASGSPRDRVDVCLEKAEISEIFQPDRVFTREDVEKGKPEPDMFFKAAAFCEAEPKDCVVVEDSTAGIRAAAAAGMECVAYLGGGHARKPWYAETISKFDCAVVYSAEELLEYLSEE